MTRSVTRSDLITSAVGMMVRFNYPATREAVNKALGTDYLPAMCARAGYSDGSHSIRAERMLITAILTKLCNLRGIVVPPRKIDHTSL